MTAAPYCTQAAREREWLSLTLLKKCRCTLKLKD